MKNIFLTINIILLTTSIYSQSFLPGYFIDNQGVKKECLIDKSIIHKSPEKFKYRMDMKSPIESITISNVKEIGINDIMTYYRYTVAIDLTTNNISNLSGSKNLELVNKEIFLELIEKGKINLYAYYFDDLTRFFYLKEGDTQLEMLDYKTYRLDSKININEDYKQELYNLLRDGGIVSSEIENIDYEEKDIMKLVKKYNNQSNGSVELNNKNKSSALKFEFYLKPKFSLSFSKAEYSYPENNVFGNTTFGPKVIFEGGLDFEFEVINNYSIFMSPTYKKFVEESTQQVASQTFTTNIDYESLKFYFGVRKYFDITKQINIYIGAAYVLDKITNSYELQNVRPAAIILNDNAGFSIGSGVKINNRFFVEISYDIKRNLTSSFTVSQFDYNSYAITFMYDALSLFKKKKQ